MPPAEDRTVVLAGEKIQSVGRSGEVSVPENATVVDGTGKFLIPGLWDMHVHTRYQGIDFFSLFVTNGVTGVRDMGGPWEQFDKLKGARRVAGEQGAPTPRIVTAGRLLAGPGSPWCSSMPIPSRTLATRCRFQPSFGADGILDRSALEALQDETREAARNRNGEPTAK